MAAPRTRIHVSPHGNLFMREIALLLGAALEDLGWPIELVTDRLPSADPGVCNLVVAPHEFFPLHRGVGADECVDAAASSVLVTTEQPFTSWYEVSHQYARVARAVLDINELAVQAFALEGIAAHRLRLGYHESWDHRAGAGGRRDLDIVFMGSLTKKREEALARLGPALAERRSRLLVHDGAVPVTESSEHFVAGDAKCALLARTKLLLNFHRSEFPYLEWHRLLAALSNGCAVLSEPVESYEPLAPWEHFFVAPADQFADYATMLLAADGLRERVADAAYRFVRDEYRMIDLLAPFLPVLEDASYGGVRRARRAEVRERLAALTATDDDTRVVRRAAIPVPTPTQRALKRALLEQRQLARRLDALRCRLDHGAEQHVEIVETTAFARGHPDVSVVVPVHDYADHVADAITSAVDSIGVTPELVVVDDHSTDRSREVVEELIAERPDAAIRLVALHANLGLSAVRNLALAHTSAALVFFLDADNLVLPHGLARLRDALVDRPDAALAYGMIAGFGDDERLISAYPWDARRLVFGNYIDAMVMIRRAVLDEVGGYSVEMQDRHGGWEDYELWLRLAAAGHGGVLVPEIVGRYRVHGTSMVATVNLDVATTLYELRDRYPSLPWPEAVEVSA